VLTDDSAGAGGGGVNPDFIARLQAGDRSDDVATSPRSVYRTTYVKPPFTSEHDDIWVESMLTTTAGIGNYPGDVAESGNWPGFAAGRSGVLNTMAPRYFNTSGIVDLPRQTTDPLGTARMMPLSGIRRCSTSAISDSSVSSPAGRAQRWHRRSR
jgi:hypothetical protein